MLVLPLTAAGCVPDSSASGEGGGAEVAAQPDPDRSVPVRRTALGGSARTKRQAAGNTLRDENKDERESRRSQELAGERLLRPGHKGASVRSLQQRLKELGYWLGRSDGVYSTLTEQAVVAFQGAEGLVRDGVAGPKTFAKLSNAGPPRARSTKGDVIEIDKSRGLILIAEDGKVRWAYHTSTGTNEPYQHPNGQTYDADTPSGKWKIYRQIDGWTTAPLGRLWRPKYFHTDGIALHGFSSVPPYPASHGCARLSMQAINFIWSHDLAPKGRSVWVY